MSEREPCLVVAYGHEPDGERVLLVAADLAAMIGARLHVVHVVDLRDYPADPDASDWEERAGGQVAEHRRRVDALLDAREPPPSRAQEVRRGDPVAEIAAVAGEQGAFMIVVGSRGEGVGAALSRLVDPSVSHGLIRRQHRPVLVVPPA
ncbi:universal stress protein [Pseudonocardia sp.]|uniref:universal stress protein n=1 Tax=Pseudonocardia sp. TaxID=60912 RepID=UPI003D14FD0B